MPPVREAYGDSGGVFVENRKTDQYRMIEPEERGSVSQVEISNLCMIIALATEKANLIVNVAS